MMLNAQVSKTVNLIAGNLFTVLSAEEKITITSLTLSGNIDARDFKTMRDEMPFPGEVDLSEVNILEYSGAEDPAYINNVIHLENKTLTRVYLNKPGWGYIHIDESVTPIESSYLGENWLNGIIIRHSVKNISNYLKIN